MSAQNVVGVLLLVAPLDRMPFHRKKRWYGTDSDLDTVGPTIWH